MEGCWINPKGEIIEVPLIGHNDYASDLLEKEIGYKALREKLGFFRSPYEILHERGWVRVKNYNGEICISGNCIDLTKPMRNTIDPAMNSAQMKTAKRICAENNYDFHKAINDKRFW